MQLKKFNPKLDAEFAVIDFKACARHALDAGDDENCRYDSITGRRVNRAEHGFRVFLDMYVTHWLEEKGLAPWQLIVCHEGGHKFRSSINPDYKANRKPKEGEKPKKGPEIDEEYEKLENYLKNFFAGIGATQVRVAGVEGDDVIDHIVSKLSVNYVCSVYTVDADLLRLAGNNVLVYLKMKMIMNSYGDFYDIEQVVPKNMHGYLKAFINEEGEFHPDVRDDLWVHLTLYKSICGDSSDGYGGITGLGDAKWKEIVANYGFDGLEELEEIVAQSDWVTLKEVHETSPEDKIMAKMYEKRDQWRQSYRLAELHPELCWKPSGDKLTKMEWFKRVPSKERVMKSLTKCAIEDYYEEYLEEFMPQYILVDADSWDGTEVDEFAELCKESFVVGWDYETAQNSKLEKGDLNVVDSEPTGVSFCCGNNFQYAFYITVDHKDSANLPKEVIPQFINAIPEETATVAHNLVFETINTAQNYGVLVDGGFDTAIMGSYVDENEEMGLKASTFLNLNYKQETYDEVLEKAGAEDMRGVTAEQVLSYGIDDSLVCCHLFVLYWLRLQLEETWDFYSKYEPTFAKRMSLSQIKGVEVDFDELKELEEEDRETIEYNTNRLRKILKEHCSSRPNVEGATQFYKTEREFFNASQREKLRDLDDDQLLAKVSSALKFYEKKMELNDAEGKSQHLLQTFVVQSEDSRGKAKYDWADVDVKDVINGLVAFEDLKFLTKCVEGSVYVDYVVEENPPAVAPSPKNLTTVAEALGLPPIESAAKSRLSAWEQEVCKVDFENDEDGTDDLEPDQKEFVLLLRDAKAHFKPDERDHQNYKKFEAFCAKVLGLKPKVTTSGTELNTGSSKQMQHFLYCMLGLPIRRRGIPKKGDTRHRLGFGGSPQTDALTVDTALAEDMIEDGSHDWVENEESGKVLNWVQEALTCMKRIKESETRFSLYFRPYPKLINPATGRMHPAIKGCGTVTRRPTGGSPNILQVSKHQKKGVMRAPFKPLGEDEVIIAIDFAGQELRILASETKDENLLSAYLGESLTKDYLRQDKDGQKWVITTEDIFGLPDVKDLHSNTGANISKYFGLDADGKLVAGGKPEVRIGEIGYHDYIGILGDEDHKLHKLASAIRKKPAKNTNFLMAYGGSGQALAEKLIIKEEVGNEIMGAAMKLYKGIEREQAETLKFAKRHGYTKTAYGNRRHATKDLFGNKGEVNRMLRQLFNFRIQGCAADILKVVIYEAEQQNVWDGLGATLIAPVYDEVVASVPAKSAIEYVRKMVSIMNLLPPNHAVPMMADVSIGPDWQKQKEIGSFPTDEEIQKAVDESIAERRAQIEERKRKQSELEVAA